MPRAARFLGLACIWGLAGCAAPPVADSGIPSTDRTNDTAWNQPETSGHTEPANWAGLGRTLDGAYGAVAEPVTVKAAPR